MLIFLHIICSFFFVLGILDFILEIKKAILSKEVMGLSILLELNEENEEKAEALIRLATSLSSGLPLKVEAKNVSRETLEICERIIK